MMHKCFLFLVLVCSIGCNNSTFATGENSELESDPAATSATKNVESRKFKFVYGAALTELEPGTKVRVWIPVATSSHDQDVELNEIDVPGEVKRTTESRFGNELIYFEAEANEDGEVPIEVTYTVLRHELTESNRETATHVGTSYLEPSTLVPVSDDIRKRVIGDEEVTGERLEVTRRLYEGIESHMKYDKPADNPGWGNGDANWACQNGFGNCTDFHSVFISSARNLKIPSIFEIGFPIPETRGAGEVGGYHCWAKFEADGKWIPVDISEADKHPAMKDYYFGNLTPDRVAFSVGRDLELVPAPAAGTINYLAYPYAEVDGKPHPSFRKAFSYEDIAE